MKSITKKTLFKQKKKEKKFSFPYRKMDSISDYLVDYKQIINFYSMASLCFFLLLNTLVSSSSLVSPWTFVNCLLCSDVFFVRNPDKTFGLSKHHDFHYTRMDFYHKRCFVHGKKRIPTLPFHVEQNKIASFISNSYSYFLANHQYAFDCQQIPPQHHLNKN